MSCDTPTTQQLVPDRLVTSSCLRVASLGVTNSSNDLILWLAYKEAKALLAEKDVSDK